MQKEKWKLKVNCLTPKGKSEKAAHEWKKQFPTFKKPIEEKVINDHEFYWIYEFDKEKQMQLFQKKTILAEIGIKKFYRVIMGAGSRANKIGKKLKWGTEKMTRWALRRINKRLKKENKDSINDFKDIINMEDEEAMREFLTKDLIVCEIIEEDEKQD